MIGSGGWFFSRFTFADRNDRTSNLIASRYPFASEWAKRASGLRTEAESRTLTTKIRAIADGDKPVPTGYETYGDQLRSRSESRAMIPGIRTFMRERVSQVNREFTPIRPGTESDLCLASSPVIDVTDARLAPLQAEEDIVEGPRRTKSYLVIIGVAVLASIMLKRM